MSREAASVEPVSAALEAAARDLLVYFARRIGDNDAADLLADLSLTAWRQRKKLPDDPETARMWLFGIARNTLANARRSEVRRWSLADKLRNHIADKTPSPDVEGALDIRAAIATLEATDAELIRLVHWDGFSVAEAAKLLDLNESTARNRHQRAKTALRAQLLADAASV